MVRFGFFRRIGAFSVDRTDPASVRASLDYAAGCSGPRAGRLGLPPGEDRGQRRPAPHLPAGHPGPGPPGGPGPRRPRRLPLRLLAGRAPRGPRPLRRPHLGRPRRPARPDPHLRSAADRRTRRPHGDALDPGRRALRADDRQALASTRKPTPPPGPVPRADARRPRLDLGRGRRRVLGILDRGVRETRAPISLGEIADDTASDPSRAPLAEAGTGPVGFVWYPSADPGPCDAAGRATLVRAAPGATFGAPLAIHADQPIVENYVGRQIPTAMVARNLERGSGFLHPTLDTGAVSQPVPGRAADLRPGRRLEPARSVRLGNWSGWVRLGSRRGGSPRPAMTLLGAWGFFGLVRRREGPRRPWSLWLRLRSCPVTLRYGRAFQPDAMMLGFVLLGLRGWDEFEASGRSAGPRLGSSGPRPGLTLKVTGAWALIPFGLIVARWPVRARLAAGAVMLAPALAWYCLRLEQLHPGADGGGSLASADNAASGSARSRRGLGSFRHLGRDRPEPRRLGPSRRSGSSWRWRVAAWSAGVGDRLWLGLGDGCGLAVLALARSGTTATTGWSSPPWSRWGWPGRWWPSAGSADGVARSWRSGSSPACVGSAVSGGLDLADPGRVAWCATLRPAIRTARSPTGS